MADSLAERGDVTSMALYIRDRLRQELRDAPCRVDIRPGNTPAVHVRVRSNNTPQDTIVDLIVRSAATRRIAVEVRCITLPVASAPTYNDGDAAVYYAIRYVAQWVAKASEDNQ